MSISTQITRLTGAKQTLTNKMDAAGYAGLSGKKIDQLIDMLDLSSSGGSSIVVTEEQDSHGGTIVHITGETLELQSKTVTPTTARQTVQPDQGKTGLSSVIVESIPSQYIVPSGTKTITENGTGIDVSAFAAVNVDVPASSPNLQAKTNIAPTESSQTIRPDNGYDGLSSVQINAVSSTYVGSGVTRKGAATITPTKSAQTIASGQYLTGTQTIAAIPAAYQDVTGVTAAAGDVVNGKKIVSSTGTTVNGTLVIQHYYTGSSAPSASLGSDGDIYLQTGG